MHRESERALLILVGIYLLGKSTYAAVVPPLKRGAVRVKRGVVTHVVEPLEDAGARLYDFVHDDAGHKQDLPGERLSRAAILAIAKNVGFARPKLAAAIAMAESLGYVGRINHTSREYSVGLWQINTMSHPTYSVSDMRDPLKNARAAFKISKGGTDWHHWGAYTDGRYKQFQTGILA